MQPLVDAIKVVLTNLWTIGMVLVVFCGLALYTPRAGIELPALLHQWIGTGLLAGVALIVVSVIHAIVAFTRANFSRLSSARATQKISLKKSEIAIANLETLTVTERISLLNLFLHGAKLFEINVGSYAYDLVRKGVLIVNQSVGGSPYSQSTRVICRLDPAIELMSDSLKKDILQDIRANPAEYRTLLERQHIEEIEKLPD